MCLDSYKKDDSPAQTSSKITKASSTALEVKVYTSVALSKA